MRWFVDQFGCAFVLVIYISSVLIICLWSVYLYPLGLLYWYWFMNLLVETVWNHITEVCISTPISTLTVGHGDNLKFHQSIAYLTHLSVGFWFFLCCYLEQAMTLVWRCCNGIPGLSILLHCHQPKIRNSIMPCYFQCMHSRHTFMTILIKYLWMNILQQTVHSMTICYFVPRKHN